MKLLRTAGVLLLTGLSTAACTAADAPAPVPSGRSTVLASPAAPSSAPAGWPRLAGGSVGADGLTVRYRGGDGRIETLRVEDFRH